MTDVDAGERCPKPNDFPPPWSEPLDELPPVVKLPPTGEAPRHVLLTRVGQYFVATECVEELAAALGLPVEQDNSPHRWRRRRERFGRDPKHELKYCWEASLRSPHIFCPAGREEDAIEHLKGLGYCVKTNGKRPPVWTGVGATQLRKAGVGFADFLELLRGHERGVVRYDPARTDACEPIAAAAIAWPKKATIVVVAGNRKEVARVTRRLEELGVPVRPKGDTSGPGAVVSTQDDLIWNRVRIHSRTLLFFLEPEFYHDGPCGLNILLAAPRARLFGLLPTDRQVSPEAEARMREVFGRRGLRVHGATSPQETGLRRQE